MIVRRLDTSILGKRPIDGEDRLHHFGPAWPWLLGLDTFGGWHKDVSWLGWWVWMRVTLSNVFDSVLV